MAEVDQWLTVLRNAHASGDESAARRAAAKVQELRAVAPDPFAGDPLISREAMARKEAGLPLFTPSPPPSPFRGIKKYLRGVNEAAGALNRAPDTGGLGTLEALGTLATGGIAAPVLGTAESIALGTPPEESFARYTYQPRSESGKSQLGLLGALADPLAKSGADVALLPLAGARPNVARRPAPPKHKPAPIPTTKQLAEAAENSYSISEAAGVVIKPESTRRAARIFREVAEAENLGKLPPKTAEAVAVLDERLAQNKPLTLKDADKVRQLIGDAMKSNDAADRRLAKIIQGRYDQYIETLSPQDILAGNTEQGVAMLNQARGLYRRRKNSEMLDAMERRATRKGETTYTQAGKEHALRRQFESLASNEKKMRMLTPEQRASVERVAAPGKTANLLRNLGKFDPARGGMGAAIGGTLGGGVGAALGGLMGGDLNSAAGGALSGQALLGVSANLANRGSAALTNRNVKRAREALVGRGLPSIPASVSQATPATVTPARGLLAAEPEPAPQGILGTAAVGAKRSADEIRRDIRKLDAKIQRLPPDEPLDSPRSKALEAEWARLRAELADVEPRA